MDRRDFLKWGSGAALSLWPGLGVLNAGQAKIRGAERLDIGPDPRIELYGVVLILGPFRGLKNAESVIQARVATPYDFAYKREVETRFGRFKDHPAVKISAEMAENGLFRLGHPPAAMLHLTDPPELAVKIPFDEFLLKMAGGKDRLEKFLSAMRAFARDSEFMAFFESHRDFYRRLAEDYRRNMEWDYVSDLEEYYGTRQSAYHLVLATLSHPGGFGPRIRTPQGAYEAYAVIGPKGIRNDVPEFGSGDAMRRLCWHEFSHPFVNPMTEAHLDQLREPMTAIASRLLPPPVVDRIKSAGMWDVHLLDQAGEYVVRGVTTRLTFRKMGPENGRAALEQEIREGFVHEEAVCRRFEIYESRRDLYPTLANFYPEIISAFASMTA